MGHGTEAAQVDVILIILQIHTAVVHGGDQLIQIRLTLGAADDLAHTGHQQVGGGHGLAVGVLLHIEGLDVLGVVGDEDGLLIDDLGDVPLVLGLQVTAPIHGILEFHVRLFQQVDGVGVVQHHKVAVHHALQLLDQALLKELVEELQLGGAVLHHVGDDVLDHLGGDLNDVRQLGEGHLRLHVPELGHVAGGVGVFGAEGGAESIDLTKGHGRHLALQLTGHGQAGTLAEEVVGVVIVGTLILVGPADGGHLKHLTGALTVAGGDEGGVDVHVVALLEIAVDGGGHHAAHAENGVKGVGAHTQMGDGAQKLQRATLLLQGVLTGAGAQHGDGGGVDLHAVALAGHQGALHLQAGAQRHKGAHVGDNLLVQHDLQVLEAGAVVHLQERHVLGVAAGAHPAADGDLLTDIGRVVIQFYDVHVFHINNSFSDLFYKIKKPSVPSIRTNSIVRGAT